MKTAIEAFAEAHQNALGEPYPSWDDLDQNERRRRIETAIIAIDLMPETIRYQVPRNGLCFQSLTEVKASLVEEQCFSDQARAE